MNEWVSRLAQILGMTARLDRRDRQRLRSDFRAVLTGECGAMEVRGLDASRQGLGVVAPDAVHPGTLVFVRLKEFGLAGFAYVRRCASLEDGNFMLGLQFRGGLSRECPDSTAWSLQRLSHTCGAWDAASEY